MVSSGNERVVNGTYKKRDRYEVNEMEEGADGGVGVCGNRKLKNDNPKLPFLSQNTVSEGTVSRGCVYDFLSPHSVISLGFGQAFFHATCYPNKHQPLGRPP